MTNKEAVQAAETSVEQLKYKLAFLTQNTSSGKGKQVFDVLGLEANIRDIERVLALAKMCLSDRDDDFGDAAIEPWYIPSRSIKEGSTVYLIDAFAKNGQREFTLSKFENATSFDFLGFQAKRENGNERIFTWGQVGKVAFTDHAEAEAQLQRYKKTLAEYYPGREVFRIVTSNGRPEVAGPFIIAPIDERSGADIVTTASDFVRWWWPVQNTFFLDRAAAEKELAARRVREAEG